MRKLAGTGVGESFTAACGNCLGVMSSYISHVAPESDNPACRRKCSCHLFIPLFFWKHFSVTGTGCGTKATDANEPGSLSLSQFYCMLFSVLCML